MIGKRRQHTFAFLTIVAAIVLTGCSAKKNTAGSRFWQAFNTRYNVYYNGITSYNEQIKLLENDYQDDYSQRLFIHPTEARNHPKSPQPTGSFDRTIEKMQKAISLHSIKKKPKKQSGKSSDPKYKEWMKRDEYNPFMHNCWYLLAKAEYMKGDFLSSAATFHYIARHFTWKPDLVQEAQLWEALNYCAMGWTTEADNVLAHVHIDKITNKRLRALANLAFADYYLQSRDDAKAIPYLAEAIKGAKGGQKTRLNFLLGQLYEENGQNDLAYQAFKRAGSSSGATYRTKFNARIKQSAVYAGNNIDGEVRSLRAMTRYGRNKEYLDQIYYAIGNLYLARRDTVNAVENYVRAAKESTRNGIDKAISQLTLGGIYFSQHKYDLAQPCYAEAIPQLGEEYPNYKELKKRSDVLDELAVYAQNVTLQDSLLRLSKLPLDEQKKVVQKIIDELKKKEKEEAEAAQREEYLAQQEAKGSQLSGGKTQAPASFGINNDKSWYFYNTAARDAGKTAFQKQWGNRKLEDNWRRRNKNTFSLDDSDDDQASTAQGGDQNAQQAGGEQADSTSNSKQKSHEDDPHYEEYYLKQIPKTDEEVQNSNNIIMEGLFNMGTILKDKLEDLPSAQAEYLELLRRYPDNPYRLDTYYNLYLLNMRLNDVSQAEHYRQLIVSDFAESKYGQAMKDPNYLENLKNMNRDQEAMYEQAYDDYLNNNNQAVHQAYATMQSKYPMSKIMPKFMFIDALAYATQKDAEKFKETLKDMLTRYPETDITPTASSMVKQLNQGRKLGSGTSNARGMIWDIRLGNDSTAQDADRQFTPFSDDKDKPQYYVFVYSTDSVAGNVLLYEVARHNFNSFVVKDYDMEQMNFGKMGLLVIKGLDNYNEALHYRSVLEADKGVDLPADIVHQVIISQNNFNLLLNEGRTFQDYFQFLEEENNKKVEAKVPAEARDDASRAAASQRKSVKPAQGKAKAEPKHEAEKPAAQPQPSKPQQPKQEEKLATPAAAHPVEQPAVEPAARPVTQPVTQPVKVAPQPADTVATPSQQQQAKPDTVVAAPLQPAVAAKEESDQGVKRLKKQKDDATKQLEREQKAKEKAAKDEAKAKEKAAKEAEKQKQRELKEQERAAKQAEKQRQDSLKQAEKDRQEALKQAEKLRADSIKQVEKQKEEALKQEQEEKEQAKRQQQQELEDKVKAKQEARKQREEERKQRAKAREEKKKAEQKAKAEAAKQRKEAAKQRAKEREEARKQREQERKQRAKERQQSQRQGSSGGNGSSGAGRSVKDTK